MAIIVTLDIYSGNPNPTWELSSEQADNLRALFSQDRQMTKMRAPASSGKLGYRGFALSTVGELSVPSKALVYDGVIDVGTSVQPNYIDNESQFEKFLLGTAGIALKQTERDYVTAEITRNVSAGVAKSDTPLTLVVPPYDPGKWNNDSFIMKNNNCYNYANDKITNSFAQPGRGSGQVGPYPPACPTTGAAAERDGQIPIGNVSSTPAEGQYIGLVIWPGNDYHWYRRDANNQWSHKPGQTPARNTDNAGQQITNPQTCNRGPYTVWCGFYHSIPSRTRII